MIGDIVEVVANVDFIKSVLKDFGPTLMSLAVFVLPLVALTTIFTLALDVKEIKKIDMDIRKKNNGD